MVPDQSLTCYGMEYFCNEGDELWKKSDRDLRAFAEKELLSIGLVDPDQFVDAHIIRQKKAYPVYTQNYAKDVLKIREELESRYSSLHLVGRNGMHKYNNQDHAMMTAMLTAKNIMAGKKLHDVWNVNVEAEYHEGAGLRATPSLATLAEVKK